MRLNPIYTLQSIAGEHFIFMREGQQVDMTRIISLNASAAWLWAQLENLEFTYEDAVLFLTDHYDVDKETAIYEIKGWFDLLRQNDLLL